MIGRTIEILCYAMIGAFALGLLICVVAPALVLAAIAAIRKRTKAKEENER